MAAPRSLRPRFAAALGLVLFSAISLFYTHSLPARASWTGHKHKLSDSEDIGLSFPNDPIPRINFASLSKYPANNINEPSKFAFSTLYCTRKPDTRGPYFEAVQSTIWRI